MLSNVEVRSAAKQNGVMLWQIANAMNISEATMTRKLRTELSESDKSAMLRIINDIVKTRV